MKNLILLITILVGSFSFAQNNGTGSSLEVMEFTHDGTEYRHVQGSLYYGENCFDGITITSQNTLTLTDNGLTGADLLLTLAVGEVDYQVLPSENNARIQEWGQFSDANTIYLADGITVVSENLLSCPSVWTETNPSEREYTNTDHPRYSIRIGSNTNNWIPRLFFEGSYVSGVAAILPKADNTVEDALAEGISLFTAYVASLGSSDDYTTTAVGSYRIINAGFSAYYVEILTPQGTRVEFRAFSTYGAAEDFARDPASYPARVMFTAADFDTTTHANPGWLRGVYQGGLAGYTVTAPTSFSSDITATWTWTDNRGHGHTGNRVFTVPSTTRYYHGSTGIYYDDIAAVMAAYPNNYQIRLDSGHFTILHTQLQADIDRVQSEAVAWAIQAINDFTPAGPTTSN